MPLYDDTTLQPVSPQPIAPSAPTAPLAQPVVPQAPAPALQPALIPGGSPVNAIRSTPQQGTVDTLNDINRSKDLTRQEGDADAAGADAAARKMTEDATEKQRQATDYSTLLSRMQSEHESAHKQSQQAYDDFRARSLKDPSSQYWDDKGGGAKVGSALASFVSGAGAGFNGQQNPFMGYLNKRIDANYEAHKQNIQDLYQSSVAAGKIEDSAENHARFMSDAKLKSYELDSAHIKSELEAIKQNTTSNVMRVKAGQAIVDLDKQAIAARMNLAHQEASGAANQLAMQRAREKEVREAYEKNLALYKDLPADEQRVEAARSTAGMGFDRSALAPVMQGNGIGYDTKRDGWAYPVPSRPANQSSDVSIGPDGSIVVPSVDPNGRRIKPEEQAKLREDAGKRTVILDGKPALALNEKAAEKFQIHASVMPEIEKTTAAAKAAWMAGDKGAYEGARQHLIEVAPQLYGYSRGPSGAQAGETGSKEEGESKGTVAAQLPEWGSRHLIDGLAPVAGFMNRHPLTTNSDAGQALAKFKAWDDGIRDTHESFVKATFARPPGAPAAPASSPGQMSLPDLAAQFGGKAL